MRSEGSDAYVEEDTSSVLEDNAMASDKVTFTPEKKGKKRTSSRSEKDNLSDLESRMMARIEEQDKQFDSMSTKMGKLFDLLQGKLTDTGNEVPRSEHENQNTVTVEALSAARRPLIPLNSAINEQQYSGDDLETLSVRISDSERQNSGFLFSAEGSENSRNSDNDDANTFDSRSVLVKSGEHDRFQKYLSNRNEKSCETEKKDKSVSHILGDKFGLDAYTSVLTEKTADGIVGSQFDAKIKEKIDRNKQLAEVLPDTRRVTLGSQFGKRKPTTTITSKSTIVKKPKFDNNFKIPKKNFGEFKSSGKQTAAANKTWIPVGGRLKHFIQELESITDDQWVLTTLQEGLKLEFQETPRLTGIKHTSINARNLHIILTEEAYPITSTSFLETLHQRSHLSNSIYTTRKKSFELVVGQSKHYQGQIITPVVGNRHNNRCFKDGVWGSLEQSDFQSFWSVQEQKQHINLLELEVVIRTVQHFLPQLQNQNVLLKCDNTTVVQYVNKQGAQSHYLCYKTWCLMKMAIQNNLTIRAAHIAGKLNIPADHLSRNKIQPTEWTLNNQIVQSVLAMWGEPTIDLFASVHNHKRPVFCTWLTHPSALAVDALSISWEKMWAYAFPPICLIPKVLKHMSQFNCRLILIAPMWPRRHWYTELLPKSFASAIKLPTRQNLLYQPNTTIYHPNPRSVQADSLALSTTISEIKGFSRETRKLLRASWRSGTQQYIYYACKFKRFNSLCSEREQDPYAATLAECADFLSQLYTSGLQYRTIAGCRSMLSSLLPPIDNVPIGQHPYMIRLLRGVFNSRPPKVNLVPEWDLQKVLDMLQKSPFEPLLKADVKCLTYKVVFLTAIATFRRCSDIQALRIGEGFVNVQKKGLVFLRPGLSKQDRPNHYGTKIFVPYFEHNKKT
ncbi:unnamed protein product [Mytilus coruscus]|uniref:Tyr recombinase domain-containing protein n=1 Tax=Mytilus coruscus TaxID=42192 RepID=A0A6J8CUF2_MYTCO|nr:unnamed protein product [Mytilus coruscus]